MDHHPGKKVAILVGQGARGATDELIAIEDTLGAGVAKAWLGKAVIPDDVPYCTNTIGLLGRAEFRERRQLLPREQLQVLLDSGSDFVELCPFAGIGMRRDSSRADKQSGRPRPLK